MRVATLLAQRPRAAQIALLCDTRPLHRLLTRYSMPRQIAGRAGHYRGAGQQVCVRLVIGGGPAMAAATCPPERVASEMQQFSAWIRATLTSPPPPASARRALGDLLATFFRIHPYLDGNGRVARVWFHRAAALLDLPLNSRWTLDRRAYGSGVWLAVTSYPVSPRPMEIYLQRFFD